MWEINIFFFSFRFLFFSFLFSFYIFLCRVVGWGGPVGNRRGYFLFLCFRSLFSFDVFRYDVFFTIILVEDYFWGLGLGTLGMRTEEEEEEENRKISLEYAPECLKVCTK